MRKLALLTVLCAAFVCAHAETLLLRTGARVKGDIIFQNDEVLVIRNAEGARFQYLRSDVAEVLTVDTEEQETTQVAEEDNIGTTKKASIALELSGGAACIPNDATGGGFGVDLLVGSHHIGDRHLFIGGGLGYHGLFIGAEKYNFLPIQVALRMPFIEQKHAPFFGAAVGYGIALSKDYLGGIYAGIDFGYRYQINEKSALVLTLFTQFQQAKINITETVNGVDFVNSTYRNIIIPGIKFGLYF